MPLDINFSQVGEAVPDPGVSANYFRANALVTITATDVDGTATCELLWKPENDFNGVLNQVNPTTWEITPDDSIMPWGGSYRFRITDDSDTVYRTFSIPVSRPMVPGGANTVDGLQIPSPMETGDNEASLGNLGPPVVRRSESNAKLNRWPRQTGGYYQTGSPWGWWRYLRDLIRWVNAPLRMDMVGNGGVSVGGPGIEGNDYNINRGNAVFYFNPDGINIATEKGRAMFVNDNGEAVFAGDPDIDNNGRYLGCLVGQTEQTEGAILVCHGPALVVIHNEDDNPVDLSPGTQFEVSRDVVTGYRTITEQQLSCGVVLKSLNAQQPGAHWALLRFQHGEST
jgi:hypothetical protein